MGYSQAEGDAPATRWGGTMADVARRLWLPALLFGALLVGALYGPDLWGAAGRPGAPGPGPLFVYVLPVAAWLAGAWLASRVLDALLWERLKRSGWSVPRLARDALTLVIFVGAIAGIVALVFGRSLTGFFAASSVMALVLGLALRTVILDIFTGIAINVDRTYQIGDWIEVHHRDFKVPVYGRVADINWRTTRVELENGNLVVIPNNVMSLAMTTNYSVPKRVARFELPVTLDYGLPTERAERLLLAGVLSSIGPEGPVEHPPPKVLLAGVSHQGVDYLVRYWIRIGAAPPNTVRSTVLKAVLRHLRAAGIEPACPKEELFHARQAVRDLEREPPERRRALLERVELLARSLQPDELASLAARMVRCAFGRGDYLVRQGEPGQSMFVLAEGLAEVLVRGKEGGPEKRIARIDPGQCIGEMSLLTGGPRSASIRALTDVVAFEIAKEHVEALLEARPELAGTLAWLVAERRLQTVQALAEPMPGEPAGDTTRLSQQILGRMRTLFRGVRETRRVG